MEEAMGMDNRREGKEDAQSKQTSSDFGPYESRGDDSDFKLGPPPTLPTSPGGGVGGGGGTNENSTVHSSEYPSSGISAGDVEKDIGEAGQLKCSLTIHKTIQLNF